MKRIPQVPIENLPGDDKLTDRVARCNPKVYDWKHDLMELQDWIRGMEKIFTVAEVLEEKKVNIGTLCLLEEVDIRWNTVKDRLLGPAFTWSKFLDELRAKFYPILVQR